MLTSDRAIVSRRFMPPERSSTLAPGLVGQADELEQLVGPPPPVVAGQPEVAPVDREVLPHGQLRIQGVVLGADAEPGADLRPVGCRVHPQHLQLAGAAGTHRRDHPHRRGLPGSVRAEEAEQLTAAHLHVDAPDGLERAVRLPQSPRPHQRVRTRLVARLDRRCSARLDRGCSARLDRVLDRFPRHAWHANSRGRHLSPSFRRADRQRRNQLVCRSSVGREVAQQQATVSSIVAAPTTCKTARGGSGVPSPRAGGVGPARQESWS